MDQPQKKCPYLEAGSKCPVMSEQAKKCPVLAHFKEKCPYYEKAQTKACPAKECPHLKKHFGEEEDTN